MRWLVPPVLCGLCILGMAAQSAWLPTLRLLPPTWPLLGTLPILAGLALLPIAAAQFRRRKTAIRPFREPDALVTDGVYAVTRNPMYLGMALILFGAAFVFNDAGAFAFVVLFVVVADRWYIRVEEEVAARRFGAEYEAYRRRVRRWI